MIANHSIEVCETSQYRIIIVFVEVFDMFVEFFNRHQLADAVLKITFSVSKIVGNVSYQINLAIYRISQNFTGRRRTSPDVSAEVASISRCRQMF